MNIVILAGGVGTRLWPLGRKNNPKQFFPMISNKPLVRETYDRFVAAYGPKKIFFSVTADLLAPLRKLFPKIPMQQFIVEPTRRDTAPAMGFVAASLFNIAPDEPMVFVPADHFIADNEKYLMCFTMGEELIKKTGKLVDIGITATFPSTVLGYTKIGKLYDTKKEVEVYHFAGHTEKPDMKAALSYIQRGTYLWHGNYYMWTPRKFLEAFEKYAPKMHTIFKQMMPLIKKGKGQEITTLYNKLEKISFDYAITEHIAKKDVLIIKGNFGWNDVGAWDVLHNQLQTNADEHGNVLQGSIVHMDTRRCLIFGHENKILATVGLQDLIIVDTPDALLVCPKERAQDVKKLFPIIEEKGLKKHL